MTSCGGVRAADSDSLRGRRIAWKALVCLAALTACATAGAPTSSSESAEPDALGMIAQTLLDSAASKYRRVAATYDPARGHPRSTQADGSWSTSSASHWTSGFYPGTLWYLHEYTLDPVLRAQAERFTLPIAALARNAADLDVALPLLASFGNAHRVTGDERFREPMLEAARHLASRPAARAGASEASERGERTIPALVEEAMSLALLHWGALHGGDTAWRSIAPRRAFTDSIDRSGGRAWRIYALTSLYRETRDPRVLGAAARLSDDALRRLPDDFVPCRDALASACPDRAQRDAASAAIMASALLELSTFVRGDDADRYRANAEQMLMSLASPAYLAPDGSAALLLHAAGDRSRDTDLDAGSVRADYYFVEALLRYLQLSGQSGVRVLGTR